MERASTRTSSWCRVTRSSSRSLLWFSAGLCLLAFENPASAEPRLRVTPSLGVSEQFTSNVFYSETGVESDYVTRIAPRVEARYDSERDVARLSAGVASNSYLRNPDLNGVSYAADLQFERNFSPRLSLDLDLGYSYYPKLDAVTEADQQIQSERPDLVVWGLGGGLRFRQSARSQLGLNLDYSGRGYSASDSTEETTQREHETVAGALFYRSSVSSHDQLDFVLSANRTHYSDTGAGQEDDSFATLLAQWSRNWNPEWFTLLSGGVLVLYSDPEGFPSETSVGFTGGASLRHETQRARTHLGYSSRLQPSSGVGATLQVHTLSGGLGLDLARALALRFEGSWQLYKSAGDGPVLVTQGVGSCASGETLVGSSCFRDSDRQVDSELTSLRAKLEWRLRKRWATFLEYRFRHQTSSGDIQVSEYSEHRVMLGVHYALPVDLF